MRMMLLKTWRDMRVHWGQFGGLMLLVVFGIMSFVAFRGGYLDLTASVARANAELRFHHFETKVIAAPRSAARQVAAVPGVAAVEGRLVVDTALDVGDGKDAVARIVSIPIDHRPRTDDLLVLEGRYPTAELRDEVLLHAKFAVETGAEVGDWLTLRVGKERKQVRVVGIAASAEYMYAIRQKGELPSPREFAVIFVPGGDAGRLLGKTGSINDFAVLLRDGADLDATIDRVEDVLDRYRIVETVKRADQPSAFALGEEIEQNRVMAVAMPALILLISASSLFITLSRLVQSQRGEIGLAKALGYTDLQVLAHYLLFSGMIALIGSVVGFASGDWLGRVIAKEYVDLLGIPFLAHHIYPKVVLQAVALSAGACVAAGIAPAWRSASLPPATAMYSDPNLAAKGGRMPIVEQLFGWALPRSFTFRIPLRNVFRARRRSLYTILGIAFALVLTVATRASFDSIDALFTEVFGRSERWDVLAVYDTEFGPERVADVRRWEGVRTVDGALMLPVELRRAGVTHEGILTALDPAAQFHGFKLVSGRQPAATLRKGELVLSGGLARKLGAGVGDSIAVKTPFRDDVTNVRVGSVSDEVLGAPAYVGLARARELLGTSATVYNTLYLRVDSERAAALKEELYDLPGAVNVAVKKDTLAGLTELMEFSYFYEALLLGFGFAMAFVVIYNTFTANVLERTREIATMRTIGESNARLAVMVTIENVLLAVVGVPLGIWLGLRTADALYAQFSSEAYSLRAVILPMSVVWVVVSIFVVLLVSEIPPIRRIFRMDLAEATKVME